ncbi:MAG: hypothetical protein ABEJ34_05735 [Haloferacaceae archaeon]
MNRRRSALLWGLVGLLTFLVLVGGYRLATGPLGVPLPAVAGVAALVGVAVTAVAYRYEPRLRAKGRT